VRELEREHVPADAVLGRERRRPPRDRGREPGPVGVESRRLVDVLEASEAAAEILGRVVDLRREPRELADRRPAVGVGVDLGEIAPGLLEKTSQPDGRG